MQNPKLQWWNQFFYFTETIFGPPNLHRYHPYISRSATKFYNDLRLTVLRFHEWKRAYQYNSTDKALFLTFNSSIEPFGKQSTFRFRPSCIKRHNFYLLDWKKNKKKSQLHVLIIQSYLTNKWSSVTRIICYI